MKNNLYFATIFDVNRFERYPNLADIKKDLFIDNPELWWKLSIVYQKNEQTCEELTHNNVATNALAIQQWLEDTFEYTIIVTPHVESTKLEETIEKEITTRNGLFRKSETKIIKTKITKEVRAGKWSFWFRDNSDAVLFSTAWKGEES